MELRYLLNTHPRVTDLTFKSHAEAYAEAITRFARGDVESARIHAFVALPDDGAAYTGRQTVLYREVDGDDRVVAYEVTP